MTHDTVRALSVRDLVHRRHGDAPDVWHLALVQRAEVWDHVRMRYLLDSLLAGYPIGSLLLCRVTGSSRVIRVEGGQRVIEDARPDSWQLLDGQQRINALFSMFTADGHYGRFYLHMTADRSRPGAVTSRRAKDESLRYIHWQDGSEAQQELSDRDRYLDLSRWYAWAGKHIEEAALLLAAGPAHTVGILNAIDPAFADTLDDSELDRAWRRLRRLVALWLDPLIPVQYLELGSPTDVLEVFTRINRAGVQVAGQDLFFAAVKTLWTDAEPTLERVVQRLGAGRSEAIAPPINRLSALRVFARLAARAAGQADLVPLAVDRLSGTRGEAVIDRIRELADPEATALKRMAVALSSVMRFSRLGFGLSLVDERLWDDVLAWAAVNPRTHDAWMAEQMPSIDAYLLGATAFRYPSVLRDPFSRLAMTEALAAGASGAGFPTRRIVEVARTLIPDLRGGRARVRGAAQPEDRLRLADSNASLFLSVAQAIPYQPQRDVFDWDHIFPYAKANLMWSPGPEGRWRRHHPHRHLVGSAGNFWALDAGANRAAQDRLPGEKFDLVSQWSADGGRPVWPRDRWWLTEADIQSFSQIGKSLEAQCEIDAAMERFRDLVTARALRLVDEVLRMIPDAELFAADKTDARAEPSSEVDVAGALDLRERIVAGREAAIIPAVDDRIERVLRLSDERGSGAPIREFIARMLSLGLQVRGYQWTISVTPPRTKAVALVAMTPNEKERGGVNSWVAPWAFAEHFPEVPAEHFADELAGIRGSLLDPEEILALAGRIERLLRKTSVGTPTAERTGAQSPSAALS